MKQLLETVDVAKDDEFSLQWLETDPACKGITQTWFCITLNTNAILFTVKYLSMCTYFFKKVQFWTAKWKRNVPGVQTR